MCLNEWWMIGVNLSKPTEMSSVGYCVIDLLLDTDPNIIIMILRCSVFIITQAW